MSAPHLAALQAALQSDVINNENNTLDRLSVPEGIDKAERLGVYQYAYKARLISILATDYDTLWGFLGDEMFHALADRYFDAHPSTYYNARWIGAKLPEYLPHDPVLKDHTIVAELAALECAIADAFDAENAPVACMEDLAAVPPEQVAQAVFVPHPSCKLLKFNTNAHAVFKAIKADETPPAPADLAEAIGVQVWRLEVTPRYKVLEAEETILLDLCLQNSNFALLCETAAFHGDPETAAARVAGYITGWLNSGAVTRIE